MAAVEHRAKESSFIEARDSGEMLGCSSCAIMGLPFAKALGVQGWGISGAKPHRGIHLGLIGSIYAHECARALVYPALQTGASFAVVWSLQD